jgi:hypothetical protein
MIEGGNWWRANEIVMRHLIRRFQTPYRCRDKAERILFRIGINLGAALIGDDGVLGHAVNIATQLEACGEPGGVCLSSSAFEKMRGGIDAEFIDLGEQSLRNIDKLACTCLMHVYELTPTAIAAVRIQGLGSAAIRARGQASEARERGWLTRWPTIAAAFILRFSPPAPLARRPRPAGHRTISERNVSGSIASE